MPNELASINRWLSITRIRAATAVALFAVVVPFFGITAFNWRAVLVLCAALCFFSLIGLRRGARGGRETLFFHLQNIVDITGITLGIGLAATGVPALLFRLLYVLVIVPASLVSVRVGLVVATWATIAHLTLLWFDSPAPFESVVSLSGLAPILLFYLVAQQSFFYGRHMERKNEALAQLAMRLTESRERLEGLVDVARTLNSTTDASELLERVNRSALEQLRASWGATFLVDRPSATFRAAAFSGQEQLGREISHVEFPIDGWPVLNRLAQERVIILCGSESASAPPLLQDSRPAAAVFLAGLYRDDDLVGFLALGYDNDAPANGAVSDQLAAITQHATIALRNAQLLDEARQASALKSEFLSTISHELRTPLNVILGYTEMLREGAAGPLTREQLDLFERIDARSRELFELIESTLQVGRMETGRDAVTFTAVSLSELIRAIDVNIAGLPRPASVRFVWDPETVGPGSIITDPGKVALVVRNLVSNAFKFTPEGHVVVRLHADGTKLRIEVSDTGIGIAPEHLPTVFEMFRQVEPSSGHRLGGVGLGLYIVKQVVERLRGTVDVDSQPGRGSVFRVVLPGYLPDGNDANEAPAVPRQRNGRYLQ